MLLNPLSVETENDKETLPLQNGTPEPLRQSRIAAKSFGRISSFQGIIRFFESLMVYFQLF
jgi:hypothetical protein